jgi:hypothetical protein
MEESPIIPSYVGIDPDPTSVVAQRPDTDNVMLRRPRQVQSVGHPGCVSRSRAAIG